MVGMPGRNNELTRRTDGERKRRIGEKRDKVEKTDKSPGKIVKDVHEQVPKVFL